MKKQIGLLAFFCLSFLITNNGFAQDYFETQKIVANDRDSLDFFGRAVAISGDYAIVGAHQEDDNLVGADSLAQAGSAYIFEKDGNGNWSQVQKIISSDRAAADAFGYAVDISGDYAIVGAYLEDQDAAGANTKSKAGAAYIFERSGGTWSQTQKLVASDRANNDRFAFDVAISGDYAIVGAYFEDQDAAGSNTLSKAGSAYIFERSGGSWTEVQKIVASDRAASDLFGTSVSISNSYAIVGAYQEDHNSAGTDSLNLSGAAYIFERDGGTGSWSEVLKAVASDRDAEDRFGRSVSISGNYAAIGSYFEDHDVAGVDSTSKAGSVYVFERSGGSWSQAQKLVPTDRAKNDNAGFSVAISGDYILFGAHKEDHDITGANTSSNTGAAYLFERSGGSWSQAQKINHSDREAGDFFAYKVAISGDNIIVGAYLEDDDAAKANDITSAGSAYILEKPDISFSSGGWEGGSGASNEPTTADAAKNIAIVFGDATISTEAKGNKLMIADGASLSINTTGSLTLSDSTKIYGAEGLIINSDATATGNFIDNGIRYINSGSAKVELYMDATDNVYLEPYHYMGSPINNHAKFTDMQNLYAYNETNLTWLAHNDMTDGFSNFSNGIGYAIRYTTSTTKSFTGSLNTGSQTVAITKTTTGSAFQYYNLLSNPYPSSISADSLIANNSLLLGANLYLWNGVDYAIYNTALSAGTAGSAGPTPDGNIGVGQGFYVVASTAGSISFENSMRGTDSDIYYRKKSFPQLSLLLTADEERNSALFTGHQMASFDEDNYDAKYLPGNVGLSISSLLNNTPYDIQSVPELTDHLFDLTVRSDKEKEVNFQLQDVIQLDGLHVYLEDREKETVIDITKNTYSTTIYQGEDKNRFKLRIQEKAAEDFQAWINDGHASVFLNGEAIKGTITLLSLDGKTLAISDNNYIKNWHSLPHGIYLLEFKNNNEYHTKKLMKF